MPPQLAQVTSQHTTRAPQKVTKLTASGFKSPRGLSPFSMDVVPSTRNPLEFTICIVNMRQPLVDPDANLPPDIRDEIASARAKTEGPDPSIEMFRYVLGSDSMQHLATWADEKVMVFPGGVVGLPDGKGSGSQTCGLTGPHSYESIIQSALNRWC